MNLLKVNLADVLVKPTRRKIGELSDEQPPPPVPPPSSAGLSDTAKTWVVFGLSLLLTVSL